MSDATGGAPAGPEHPVLLPWYAAGSLDAWTARRIEEHVRGCADCRRELDALISMGRTLRRHEGTDHLEFQDLLGFDQRSPADDDVRAATLRQHLGRCETCAAELEALRAARRELGAMDQVEAPDQPVRAPAAARSPRWRMAFFAAAAAALILVVPALRGLRPGPNLPGPREIHPVRLMAPTRGDEAESALPDAGPWVIEVVLPFGAPAGDYDVRIAARGEAATGIAVHARATADGILGLFLPALPPGNHFEIRAIPRAAAGRSYAYAVVRGEPHPDGAGEGPR